MSAVKEITTKEINLLPLRFRQRIAVRRILGRWGWVAAGVAALCSIHVAIVFAKHERRRADVVALREQSQPVQAAMQRRDMLRHRHRELLGVHGRIDALMPSDDLLQTLGAIATATVQEPATAEETPAGARVQSVRIDLAGASTPAKADQSTVASPDTHVALTAVARDDATLNQLIVRLRNSGRFRDVRLRGTAEHDAGGGRRAEVEAEVLVVKELPQ